MDEFSRTASTHVDLNRDALQGISLRGFKVEIVLSTDLVPLVCLYARNFSSAYEVTVRHPVGSEDTATMISGTAITTFVCFRVMNVAVSILDVLVAGLIVQVVCEAAVSVVDTVRSVDTVNFVVRITDVIVISSRCSC